MGYTRGQEIHCSAEFKAYVTGVLQNVDPDYVYFKYKRPGMDTITYIYGTDAELKKSATGKYYVDLDTTGHAGTWFYKFYSLGQYQAAQQGSFDVDKDLV